MALDRPVKRDMAMTGEAGVVSFAAYCMQSCFMAAQFAQSHKRP